jgi:threonine aldolase
MTAIDLRSDTVTQPSEAMREAIARAEVGDDVFGDDPSVNRLQAASAERFGADAALFFPSGTQANLAAVLAHCARGEECIVGQQAHTYRNEAGGMAVLGSVQPQAIANQPDGSLDLDEVEAAIKPDDPHYAITRLLALENTIDGKVLSLEYMRAAIDLAHRHGLAIHLDGARVFNASVKLGLPVAKLCDGFDTVSVCLSKGLGAPVGTVLVGRSDVIGRARRIRKLLGGGMRQAGVLAAAGLVALGTGPDGEGGMIRRLAEDHANARRLADGLASLDGVRSPGGIAQPDELGERLDPANIATNFVLFRVDRDRAAFLAALEARDVWLVPYANGQIRAVTHYGITAEDIDDVVATVAEVLRDTAPDHAGEPASSAA